jgi:hypothetical protein
VKSTYLKVSLTLPIVPALLGSVVELYIESCSLILVHKKLVFVLVISFTVEVGVKWLR